MKYSRSMRKSTSVFLDGLRVLAAMTVFAAHIVKILYTESLWVPGHAMVIVFFVLSGYVIAFSSLGKEGLTAKKYSIARLSRLYSVVAPALGLTAFLLLCGRAINPTYYTMIHTDHEWGQFVMTGLFLQSVWWRNLVPHANGPFWSLGYEFWYYVIFGVVIFGRNWKWKVGLVLLCCLIVGGNVLLLFPIWLLGVALYIYRDTMTIPHRLAAGGFAVMVGLTLISMYALPEYPVKGGYPPLFYSASFVTDWILGLELAAVIWFYTRAFEAVSYPESLARAVQWAAGHTFSLYLYHYPTILFFYAVGIFNPYIWWQALLEIVLILGFIIALSEVTESKRLLWRKAMERAWDRWQPQPLPLPGGKKPA
jgi:peptidoglycan/LPS O-acetylase OafA/YrhL